MKNHTTMRRGTSTTRYRFGGSTGADSVLLPHHHTNLQGVLSSSGNFSDPTDHRYSIFEWSDFTGTDGIYIDNGDFVETGGVIGTGASDQHFAFPLFDETQVLNEALSDIYEQVRGNLDLSIDIAEHRSTQKMISYRDQLGQFARRLTPAKVASGLWLQAQYGWLPLAGSIYSGCDEIFRQQTNNWARLRSRSSDQEVLQEKVTLDDGTVLNYLILNYAQVEFKVGYRLGGFSLPNWTSLNPVSIAWELMPFSFVIDWVYNVGSYVRSMESALMSGKSFTGGYVTIVRSQQCSIQKNFAGVRPGSPSSIRSFLTGSGSSRRVEYSRTVLYSPPLPRPPIVKVDLGWRRLISGAALLEQLLPDRRGPRQRGNVTS